MSFEAGVLAHTLSLSLVGTFLACCYAFRFFSSSSASAEYTVLRQWWRETYTKALGLDALCMVRGGIVLESSFFLSMVSYYIYPVT